MKKPGKRTSELYLTISVVNILFDSAYVIRNTDPIWHDVISPRFLRFGTSGRFGDGIKSVRREGAKPAGVDDPE